MRFTSPSALAFCPRCCFSRDEENFPPITTRRSRSPDFIGILWTSSGYFYSLCFTSSVVTNEIESSNEKTFRARLARASRDAFHDSRQRVFESRLRQHANYSRSGRRANAAHPRLFHGSALQREVDLDFCRRRIFLAGDSMDADIERLSDASVALIEI